MLLGPAEAENLYRFRVYLRDKGDAGFSIERPEMFLSEAAMKRRARQGIAVTAADLPIAPTHFDTLAALGARPLVSSKWLATVVVESADSSIVERISRLPIVDSVKWVWQGESRRSIPVSPAERTPIDTRDTPREAKGKVSRYGYATPQIEMLDAIRLHEMGYQGEGIQVAVIDEGFLNADRLCVFDSTHIAGTYNMVEPGVSVYAEGEHGTKVLSCLAANKPGIMVGTAPKADYWLIRSEDSRSEYPIEEDYWTAAVELADSLGVDVISSSLGYFTFDVDSLSHKPEELDGRTALISRAAQHAAETGILLFCSAGNEGNGAWGKITFPADAPDVMTVGAVTEERQKSSFSSVGFTADYRVKPDAVALGSGSCVIDPDGNISYSSGTSFATPILAGTAICLWQALPQLTNRQIIDLLREVGSQAKRPDAELGYGIPDLYKAYKQGKKEYGTTADNDR